MLTTVAFSSGIYWNCCMIDQDNFLFFASWDTAQMSEGEVSRHCDLYADVLRSVSGLGNWGRELADSLSESSTHLE